MAGSTSNSWMRDDLLDEGEGITRESTAPFSAFPSSRRSRVSSGSGGEDSTIRPSRTSRYSSPPGESTSFGSATATSRTSGSYYSPYVAATPSPVSPAKPPGGERRYVLALDFGTTFTGIAFALVESSASSYKIEVIRDWGPAMNNMDKVPSVMSYTSHKSGRPQWGADIGIDDLTVINQKLELELQESVTDELDLTLYVLNGTRKLSFDYIQEAGSNPDFPCKTPDQIVTEFLRRVFERTRGPLQIEQLTRTHTPLDMVITMPVEWTYQARNSVYRASRAAGFNATVIPTLRDTILVSEPEAAAYFTARDSGTGSLQAKKCFVLCDAGGGTVDSVTFQVKQLHPSLVLKKVTHPTGRKCGSALIDTEFKRWLRKTIGDQDYAKLDPIGAKQRTISPYNAEPGPMRTLIKSFYDVKSKFTNQNQKPIKIELPKPLNRLTKGDRVNEGELVMQWHEMKMIMDRCVNPTVDLILAQIEEVGENRGTEVKTIFLVGGFGASPYLQEELRSNFEPEGIKVVHPAEDSLTAVVQGAVIHGIERPQREKTTTMTHMTKSYGHVDKNSGFRWFVRWGDLILDGKRAEWHSEKFWVSPPSGMLRSVVFRLFRHDEDTSGDDTALPGDWNNGWNDVEVAGLVNVPKSKLSRGSESSAKKLKLTGPFKWRIVLDKTQLYAELLLGEKVLEKCENIATAKTRSAAPRKLRDPYDEEEP